MTKAIWIGFLLVVTVVTFTSAASVKSTTTSKTTPVSNERTGECPDSSGYGICSYDPLTSCKDDGACSGSLKCCNNGCGKICVLPILPDQKTDDDT